MESIIEILKEKGFTEAQICFLVKALDRVRDDRKNADSEWNGADASVKSVLYKMVDKKYDREDDKS